MFHGVALVDADISLQDASDQETPVSLEDAVIQTHLSGRRFSFLHHIYMHKNQTFIPTMASLYSHFFSWVLQMFLEGPGDSGLKGFGNALQESAAPLDSVQLLLSNAMLMMV